MKRWAVVLAVVLVASMSLGPVATAGEQDVDDRVHVSFVAGVIDGNGELWLLVGMYAPLGPKPPTDVFSLFFSLYTMVGDDSSEIGWQTHAGVAEVLAAGAAAANPKIFILDNGSILVGTGLFPALPFTGTVDASFASWQDESTTSPVSGSMMQDIDSASMEAGNPFNIFGLAVYNLASTAMLGPGDAPNSPVAETTTTTITASTFGAAQSTTTSTLATSTSSGPTVTTGLPATIDDGGVNFLVFLFLLLLLLGFLYWLIVFFFGWWTPPWGAPRPGDVYGDKVDDELGDGDDQEDGEDRDTQRDTKGDDDTNTNTDTDTTGSDDDDEGDDEEDPEEDRDTRPDCTELRAECERLKVEAAEAELDAQQAQASAENAQAACDRARQRAADAQARVTDLMGRADAEQLYQRTAEAQIVLREAQTEMATICDLVDPARSEAQAAASRAAQAKAAADAACKAAEDCEAAAAN